MRGRCAARTFPQSLLLFDDDDVIRRLSAAIEGCWLRPCDPSTVEGLMRQNERNLSEEL